MLALRFILCTSLAGGVFAADSFSAKPLRIEFEVPRLVYQGGIFPYLWVLRDGSALLQVAKGKRVYRRPFGFEYDQQDPGFVVSRDGLKSWQPWSAARGLKELPWFEGAVTQLGDGSVLMFEYIAHKVSNGVYEGRLWRSNDGWTRLEGPESFRLSVPQYENQGDSDMGKPFNAVPWHRSVIEMPDGSLLAAIYGRFQGDTTPADYQPSMKKFRAFTAVSRDRGKTWSYLATIASAPVEQEGFDEPVMVRFSQGRHKGRLIVLMRTGRVNPVYQSESDDDGQTWNQAHPLRWMYSRSGRWRDISGTDPDLIEMRDGTLAMSFGHKPDMEDDGNFVAFSADQGQSWTQVVRLSMERTCAYTSIREIEPGVLYVTYSAGGHSATPWSAPQGSGAWRYGGFHTMGQRIRVRRQ